MNRISIVTVRVVDSSLQAESSWDSWQDGVQLPCKRWWIHCGYKRAGYRMLGNVEIDPQNDTGIPQEPQSSVPVPDADSGIERNGE